MKGLFKRLSILTASLAMIFGVGLVNNEKKHAKAAGESTYVKVTEAPTDWTGEYVLVYENSATEAYVWTGIEATNCYETTEIANSKITFAPTAKLNIASMTGGYSIKVAGGTNDGKYVVPSSNANGVKFQATALASTLSITEGEATIISSGGAYMRFNATSNQMRFRFFKSGTYTGQKAVQLYKLDTAVVDVETLNVTTTSFTLTKGDTAQIEASISPDNASEKGILYSVDAGFEDYISVDENGLITAKNAIEAATITVKAKGDETKTATVTVKVEALTADETINLINAIGTVEYTDESKAKIDAARASYESLDESTKALVTNYQTLLNAESKYEELKQAAIVAADKKAAADVDALINAIGEVTDYSKKNQIEAARKAYEALTETQKGYVTALETLTNAETELDKYKPLQYEIDTGKDKAENNPAEVTSATQLETLWSTPDGISWVSGSKVYGSDTETLKLGIRSVSGYVKLKLDSNDYYVTNVIVSAKAYGSDAATLYVNDLDKVSLTKTATEYTFDISSSKTQDIEIGTGAKRAYIYGITVQYAKKDIIIDQNKVNAVIELINSIGTVEASLTSMKAIEKAEAAYEELLTAEKELVTNYTTLTTARTTFDSLVKNATTVSGIDTGYTSYDFTIGELKMNTNIGGNSNCVGFNSKSKSKATLDSTIASAIEGASTTTTGMIALHAEFYNGFISLDLKAMDAVAGNAYVLSSNNGGKTYTLVNTTAIDTGTNGIEFKIEANLVDITDFVIVIDASSSSAARLTVNSITYYDNLVYSEDLTILLDELSKLDSCTNYDDAASVRELLNGLSERDQVLFSRAEIEDLDSNGNIVKVNAEAKLSYMEAYAAHMAKNSSGSNIMSNLANSNSVSFVLIIGIIGLGSILGYYFINKKRMLSK